MLVLARLLFALAVPAAIGAMASRFVDLSVLHIHPSTWLKVTALCLLASVAASLLQMAANQAAPEQGSATEAPQAEPQAEA